MGTPISTVHPDNSCGLAFSPDGHQLAVGYGGADGPDSIDLYDVKTGKTLRTLLAHKSLICALRFSPDGRLLIPEAPIKL